MPTHNKNSSSYTTDKSDTNDEDDLNNKFKQLFNLNEMTSQMVDYFVEKDIDYFSRIVIGKVKLNTNIIVF